MIVSLPLALLLLDLWPLGRWKLGLGSLVREKIPLFALSAVVSVVTVLAQRSGGAVADTIALPVAARLANAISSYVVYLRQFFWPSHLAFYPYDTEIPPWKTGGAVALLLIASACVYMFRSRKPLVVGWLWFLMTLVPAIGLIQAGSQAHADRYMYVPMIGLLIALAWTLPEPKPLWISALCAVLAVAASFQASAWKNSETLFRSAIANTTGNYVAYNGLGLSLTETGRPDAAVENFEAALRIRPEYPDALINLSDALLKLNRPADAIRYLEAATRLQPSSREARVNLGSALLKLNRPAEAVASYEKALQLSGNDPTLQVELAKALATDGKYQAAIAHVNEAIAARPNVSEAHSTLGLIFVAGGNLPGAEKEFAAAVSIDPGDADAHFNLGTAFAAQGKLDPAISEFQAALKINPSLAAAHLNLGKAFAMRGEIPSALHEFRTVLQLDPTSQEASTAIGALAVRPGITASGRK